MVNEELLLDLSSQCSIDVVFVRRAGASLSASADDISESDRRGTLKVATEPSEPLVYTARLAHATEAECLSLLQECADAFNLTEAFERMRSALSLLAQEDKRYQ
jgi:hypothetical protein